MSCWMGLAQFTFNLEVVGMYQKNKCPKLYFLPLNFMWVNVIHANSFSLWAEFR